MDKMILILIVLAFYTNAFCQGNGTVKHNRVYYISNDTIIEGTEIFSDDGLFDATNIKSDNYEYGPMNTTVLGPNNSQKTITINKTFDDSKTDTIQYPFDIYACKDIGIMSTPDIVISAVLYKYSYINSVFATLQNKSPIVRIIEPKSLWDFSYEYNEISVFDEGERLMVIKKHAVSKDLNGLAVDKVDTFSCVSKMNVKDFKRLYKKLNISKMNTAEIDASYNPYLIEVGNKKMLISPINADRRFKNGTLSRLVYFVCSLKQKL